MAEASGQAYDSEGPMIRRSALPIRHSGERRNPGVAVRGTPLREVFLF